MNNYYTSLQDNNGEFVGYIYNSANNNVIYQTKSYPTQEQVNLEIAEFLKTNEQPDTNNLPQIETTAVNSLRTVTASINRIPQCCGGG